MYHEDPTGADHLKYTKGLTQALDGYLNGLGFEKEMQNWFDFPVLPTRHTKGLIEGFWQEKYRKRLLQTYDRIYKGQKRVTIM